MNALKEGESPPPALAAAFAVLGSIATRHEVLELICGYGSRLHLDLMGHFLVSFSSPNIPLVNALEYRSDMSNSTLLNSIDHVMLPDDFLSQALSK